MDAEQRKALESLYFNFAPAADDLWQSQGSLHVGGLHDETLGEVMNAYRQAERQHQSNPLGVVIRGQAGSGKTHLLGQVRAQVQDAGGFFFMVELLDGSNFWRSARGGILESLGRPSVKHETQLRHLLWELTDQAHTSRVHRKDILGEDELTPEVLDEFVIGLRKIHPEVKNYQQTLRALVLLASADFRLQDIGEAFLISTDLSNEDRERWSLETPPHNPEEGVRAISRVVALAGPAVMALDQIDGLLAHSAVTEDSGNGDLERVAQGLLLSREIMRRTVTVVACLPEVWELIRSRAVAPVKDRYRMPAMLGHLPTAAIGRAILERRLAACYQDVGFTPPYPTWPVVAKAFDEAPKLTPRELLQRVDKHKSACLASDEVKELQSLIDDQDFGFNGGRTYTNDDMGKLDRLFDEYKQRAVVEAALDPESEDTTVPPLITAALHAWITEQGEAGLDFHTDPPQGKNVVLHARLRQTLNTASEDERHWAFRAIAATNALAAQNRVKKAWNAAGIESRPDRRQLFLVRNGRWPSGPKTAQLISDFETAGGHVLAMSDEDLRTMSALNDLIDDKSVHLPDWLRLRKPAHGIALLREALGDDAGDLPPPIEEPVQEDDPADEEKDESAVDESASGGSAADSDNLGTAVPLGVDESSGLHVAVELRELRKHCVVFAGSGSGKTVLIRRIIEEAARRGVSSIVLDPNNDLSRLGSAWPELPPGWDPADDGRAADYLKNTEVIIWTPRRSAGRPLSFQPLPDFSTVVDDEDEFNEAVDSAAAALDPRALIAGNTAKANHSRAVLREALQHYGREPSTSLVGFLEMLNDLPEGVSGLNNASKLAREVAQNLRAAMVNDPMFGGAGAAADPGALLTPTDGYRARVSVISMIGLTSDEQRQGFVNQLQMALFSWIKRNPAGERPLGGLLIMDEAQNFAPSDRSTTSTRSTLALSSQARKYGLGLIFATQAPRGLHNHIPGNAATQFYGRLSAPAQIAVANEIAHSKGGVVPDIGKLRAGNFYAALEGAAFHKIRAPWCLSYHPQSPPTTEEVLGLAREDPED
jgi:adenylylsulfate kinase-like enzyme